MGLGKAVTLCLLLYLAQARTAHCDVRKFDRNDNSPIFCEGFSMVRNVSLVNIFIYAYVMQHTPIHMFVFSILCCMHIL